MGHTTISINDELKKKAKENQINISALTEHAIKEKLGEKTINIRSPDKCQECGKIEEKATRDNPIGLTWLWPDEIWICEPCLKERIRRVPVSVA